MTAKTDAPAPTILIAAVWLLRLAVGGIFVVSGLSKTIDVWGFVFKIEEYLHAWDLPAWRSLSFVAAMALSVSEFLLGCMLLLGAFRRSVTWWMLLLMAFMLPLSAYIMIAEPVSDCGCFGDFLIISNRDTFIKNIFITLALAVLARYNMRAGYLFNPYVQWIALLMCIIYILPIGFVGYNVQPLVDFRSFAIGRNILELPEETEDTSGPISYIYERDGAEQRFTLDNLPDSTWTFVRRIEPENDAAEPTEFVVLEDGEDISSDIVASDGGELRLLIIPEPMRADITYTPRINEINDYMTERSGRLVALVAGGNAAVDYWTDISLAHYPVYTAEPTMLKELSRGTMSLVGLDSEGTILWKRTVASLPFDSTPDGHPEGIMRLLCINGTQMLAVWSIILASALFVLFALCSIHRPRIRPLIKIRNFVNKV